MGDTRSGPMCLRAEREKTNQDTDEQTNVDPEEENRRTGNGRCKAGKCTGWLTPSGQTEPLREHPGQTCPNSKEKQLDTGAKKGGRNQKAQKVVKNALEEELIEEMYRMIL